MEYIIAFIVVILIAVCIRKCQCDAIRRTEEEIRRNRALRDEKNAREMEEKCLGKPLAEQAKIREEYRAKREAQLKFEQSYALYLDRKRIAAEAAEAAEMEQRKKHGMSRGTKDAMIFLAGAAVASMENDRQEESEGSSRRKNRSHGCGCDCDDCLEGRHEDCEDECELW